ncbi:transmembrane protein 98 isoform X2 [Nilaparvata lugens]|uniref:transmembrane protein 98 isoform X2 n=1 Tax=Nilaparvata lugens TaxID=108931 RepID=UPI00193DB205|nr:transmembrane protein 98 isoform X2 [Nilaparvata lugens]
MELWLMAENGGMDIVIAIGALASVFIGAFVSLVMVCRHRTFTNKNTAFISKVAEPKGIQFDNTTLLGSDLELGEVLLHPYIEHILLTENWTADASDLITHCLEIVKLCRHVTNTIAAYSVGHHNSQALYEIVQVAKQVSDCVDDVVRTMYCPPVLDASLLEARCLALVLTVTQLILVAKHGLLPASPSTPAAVCERALEHMRKHLTVLREAALVREAAEHDANSSVLL